MLKEVQNVYRSQNVPIDDKHIEIIIAQMLRKVKADEVGDTSFYLGKLSTNLDLKKKTKKSLEKVVSLRRQNPCC